MWGLIIGLFIGFTLGFLACGILAARARYEMPDVPEPKNQI